MSTKQTTPALKPSVQIARETPLEPIGAIGRKLGLTDDDLEYYGKTKAKVSSAVWERVKGNKDGRLILVTAMTPTPAGEGKTVTSIGLAQALGRLGIKHALCLREPSLGPVFGIKGGAAGGGYAQVAPMEEINLHFTGDIHAITSAHNLLAAILENHLFQGNALGLDPEAITWRRSLDMCDRQLRNANVGLGGKEDGYPRMSGFDITAASEIMAILSLCRDLNDLEARLSRIVIGSYADGRPAFAKDLNVVGAMCLLLRDALKPNLVQTLEHTPAFVHCGPFGNIAHGCNSIVATRLALKLADYVVTEAGFGADLGAEKFLHIKCREAGIWPSAVVVVATAKSLKYHGGAAVEDCAKPNRDALEAGFPNLRRHIENMRSFNLPVLVAINRFPHDSQEELTRIAELCADAGAACEQSEVFIRGGEGGIDLAKRAIDMANASPAIPHALYRNNWPIKQKVETLAKEIYRASSVTYRPEAEEQIARIERWGMADLPLCIAKTQFSFSDNKKLLNAPEDHTLHVREVKVSNGAGFLVVVTGKMMLMPGLPKTPAAEAMGLDEVGNIVGLY